MTTFWMAAALACGGPTPFTTSASATPTPDLSIEGYSITIGRGPRSDDLSCGSNDSWLEVTVDVPEDHGVRVGVYPQTQNSRGLLGANDDRVFQADGTLVFSWSESGAEADEALHFGLFLTPVDPSGAEGPMLEIETYDPGGRDSHQGWPWYQTWDSGARSDPTGDSGVVATGSTGTTGDTGTSAASVAGWFGCNSSGSRIDWTTSWGRRR